LPSAFHDGTPSRDFNHLPLSLIVDGRVVKHNIELINKDINWLIEVLRSNNIESIKDVLICVLDENDKIFIQQKRN